MFPYNYESKSWISLEVVERKWPPQRDQQPARRPFAGTWTQRRVPLFTAEETRVGAVGGGVGGGRELLPGTRDSMPRVGDGYKGIVLE